jgi:single-strand selective monofunctional uracil DNA glycosylase
MAEREELVQGILKAGQKLSRALNKLDFSSVAAWVYNPLDYAWGAYAEFVERFVSTKIQCLYMGMNPGPWGMVQTGIPFGEVAAVRDWLAIKNTARLPTRVHPKRPIEGLACRRSEVSGKRLWGLFADRYVTPERFFESNFVTNYCPLAFMDEGARNLTPDKFPTAVREPLEKHCDQHLATIISLLKPRYFIGIGGFAEQCAQRCLDRQLVESNFDLHRILHPSPASPAANRDWSGQVTKTLTQVGVWT